MGMTTWSKCSKTATGDSVWCTDGLLQHLPRPGASSFFESVTCVFSGCNKALTDLTSSNEKPSHTLGVSILIDAAITAYPTTNHTKCGMNGCKWVSSYKKDVDRHTRSRLVIPFRIFLWICCPFPLFFSPGVTWRREIPARAQVVNFSFPLGRISLCSVQ